MTEHLIGQYRIITEIGAGGMGVVYLAEHTVIDRKAVIKVLRPELARNPEVIQRFFNEAKAPNHIEHPDIVEIYDVGTTADGSAYIVMELLKGRSLGALLDAERTVSESAARAIGIRVARALHAAHQKGIVHRDLKPDNVFIIPDPDDPTQSRVKLLDFGIAKLTEVEMAGGVQTKTSTMLGTPAYMAPEQCIGAKNVDARSDMYSLGVMLYHMLTGQVPFRADTLGGLIAKHLQEEPRAPRDINPTVSDDLQSIILCCLAKKPEARFADMASLAEALAAPGAESIPHLDSGVVTSKMPAMSGTPFSMGIDLAGSAYATASARTAVAKPADAKGATTLGQSAAELTPSVEQRPGRWRVLVPAVIAVAALGATAGVLFSSGRDVDVSGAADVADDDDDDRDDVDDGDSQDEPADDGDDEESGSGEGDSHAGTAEPDTATAAPDEAPETTLSGTDGAPGTADPAEPRAATASPTTGEPRTGGKKAVGKRDDTKLGSGEVTLISDPLADVKVDGKPSGSTPARMTLSAGKHVVVFTTASGKKKRVVVRVKAGKTLLVNETLR